MPGTSVTHYGYGELKHLAAQQSCNWDPAIMAAIATAESGGRPRAISPTHDYGLWQINRHYWGGLFAEHPWYNPHANAWMACYVWKRQGYSAWATYNSGRYLRYLHGARVAKPKVVSVGVSTPLVSYADVPGPGADDWDGWIVATGKHFLFANRHLNDLKHRTHSIWHCFHSPHGSHRHIKHLTL